MECLRCGHQWNPRIPKPNQCPKCKQTYYDRVAGWEYLKGNDNNSKTSEQPKIITADKLEDPKEEITDDKEPTEEEIEQSLKELEEKGEIKKDEEELNLF